MIYGKIIFLKMYYISIFFVLDNIFIEMNSRVNVIIRLILCNLLYRIIFSCYLKFKIFYDFFVILFSYFN